MKKIMIVTLVALFGICMAGNAVASDAATKDECIAKCKEAAEMINKGGLDAAVAEIGKKDGKFVWKDTYVFLMDMNGKMLAHPVKPALTEKESLLDITDKNAKSPKKIFVEFVNAAKSEKGEGWVDYMWPKPGEEKPASKDTFIYRVPGKDLFVGAGIYK
ncbi:cache domain-containing protein [Desulfococcaceae bacterium HSG8]|nr:cache domain-containing protein [Desulfococcaceae bacterium HSG8]